MCGEGTYRMMREVIQKDVNDAACQPEWREVKCARQWCTALTVLRPDRNILPYPGDRYYVGITFKLFFSVLKISLSAPVGYSFGEPGDDCFVSDHDMVNFYKGCKVGVQAGDGNWTESRSITISLDGALPPSTTRYHFMVPVTNPACPHDRFIPVTSVGEEPGPREVCNVNYDQNLWEMQLTKEVVTKGHQPIISLWAAGYELHNPETRHSESVPDSKDLFETTPNDSDFVSLEADVWQARAVYCSPRSGTCPGGAECPRSGICPRREDGGELQDSLDLDDGDEAHDSVDAELAQMHEMEGADE